MARLPPFEASIKSNAMAVREVLSQFAQALSPLDLDKEEAGTVELVLAEALNNIVEHAYSTQNTGARIKVSCTHHADGLHLQISDQGEEMSIVTLTERTRAPFDLTLDELPEGGFGWFLIQDLAKDILYQRVDQENHLSMRLAVGLEHPCDC
ncbi:MAG: ATP-binding protein [Paracoccaceae bacterium]|nr:ATP-binding protein [Paracoccaceae bacterium]